MLLYHMFSHLQKYVAICAERITPHRSVVCKEGFREVSVLPRPCLGDAKVCVCVSDVVRRKSAQHPYIARRPLMRLKAILPLPFVSLDVVANPGEHRVVSGHPSRGPADKDER